MTAWIHFCLALTLVAAPGQTLRDQVRLGATEIAIHNEYAPARNLGELIQESELIVRGLVISARSQALNEKIVTDFRVQVLDSIRARGNATVEGAVITVRQPGGTVLVDGKTITAVDNQFPALLESDEYVFFLSKVSSDVYAAARGAQSVFQVTHAGVKQLPSAFGTWRGPNGKNVTVQEFAELIRRVPAIPGPPRGR
jgi:hypothetical protein